VHVFLGPTSWSSFWARYLRREDHPRAAVTVTRRLDGDIESGFQLRYCTCEQQAEDSRMPDKQHLQCKTWDQILLCYLEWTTTLAMARGADGFTWAIRRQAPTASHGPAASRAQYQRIGRIQGNMRETREELCCLFGEFVKHT
jgi:hypothetical protein